MGILQIKTTDQLESLFLDPIYLYIFKGHLRWAEHVFRMTWNFLPKKKCLIPGSVLRYQEAVPK